MSDTVLNIQEDVRFWANNKTELVESGQGLRLFNQTYQGMFLPDYRIAGIKIGRRWPEATQEDTSLTMVAGTEQYAWPTSPVFRSGFYLEGLDASASNEPYTIWQAIDMDEWSALDDSNNATPSRYRLIDVSGTVMLAIRRKPDSADGIRITGMVEVTEMTGPTSVTIFLNKDSDRALAMFIAAELKGKRGDGGYAAQLAQNGVALLPRHDLTPMLRPSGYVHSWPVSGV